MDNLMSWDNPSPFMNVISVPLCRWSNQHDTYLQSSADCRAISGEVELNEALLKSISELPGNNTCEASSDLDRSNQIMESINGTLDLDLLQHQGTINLAAVDSTLATLGQGTIRREEALTSQLRCFCSVHHPKVLNSIVSPLQHFGSLEKLHSDDNVDGVTIFSSSENIRKLSSSGNLSLGESENHDSYTKLEVSNYYPVHNEVTSQGSSKPDPRPHTKRELEDFVGREKCHPCNLLQSNSTTTDGGFKFISENSCRLKKLRSEKCSGASNIDFRQGSGYEPDTEAMSQVKEMIYRAAALRPVSVGVEEPLEKPRRKNVRMSSDPQTVAARHRRERISERLRVLQRLVPGGSKMDIASMLDEAANYLKYLKSQVNVFEAQENNPLGSISNAVPFPTLLSQASPMQTLFPLPKP